MKARKLMQVATLILMSEAAMAQNGVVFDYIDTTGRSWWYRSISDSCVMMLPRPVSDTSDSHPNNDSIWITETLFIPSHVTHDSTEYTVTVLGNKSMRGSRYIHVNIPATITSIRDSVFMYSRIRKIEIPYPVTEIGACSFYSTHINSVTIPKSLKTVGSMAFEFCDALDTVVYQGTLKEWCNIDFGKSSNPLHHAHNLYINGQKVTQLDFPLSQTSVKREIFYGCTELSVLNLHNSVVSIGDWAFAYCDSLPFIHIPNSVMTIEDAAFKHCSNVEEIVVGSSVISIGEYAFAGCSRTSSITSYAVVPPVIGSVETFAGIDKTIPVYVPEESVRLYMGAYGWKNFENIIGGFYGNEEQTMQAVQAYPNPTTGIFHIETGFEGTSEVAVYDTEGRRVLSRTTEGNTVEIDLGNQLAGLYYYSVANGDRRLSGKVLKK